MSGVNKYIAAIQKQNSNVFKYGFRKTLTDGNVTIRVIFSDSGQGRIAKIKQGDITTEYTVNSATNDITLDRRFVGNFTFQIYLYDGLQEILFNKGEIWTPTRIYPTN